jgi:lysophospholipase L1-like esterase
VSRKTRQRSERIVKQAHWGLVLPAIILAATAAFLLARAHYGQAPDADHRTVRQFMLYLTFSRVDDPIIVLGDSIVEASTLPTTVCGHPIVNGGLNGASTASDLGGWLAPALANKRAFAIIVALGVNDALTPTPPTRQIFESRYGSLLHQLSQLTTRLFVIEISPVEVRQRLTPDLQKKVITTIHGFNSTLPELARQNNATFLPLPEMSAPFSIDGVHLNAEGYRAWDNAVMQGAAQACG